MRKIVSALSGLLPLFSPVLSDAGERIDYWGFPQAIYFLEKGGVLDETDEYPINISCLDEHDLTVGIPLTNDVLHRSTDGQNKVGGENAARVESERTSANLYLTIGDNASEKQNPFDDTLFLKIDTIHQGAIFSDGSFVWEAKFEWDLEWGTLEESSKKLKSIFTELKKPESYLKIASWNKTIHKFYLPPGQKQSTLAQVEKACLTALSKSPRYRTIVD